MKPHVVVIVVLGVVMTGLWLWEPTLFEFGGGAAATAEPAAAAAPAAEPAAGGAPDGTGAAAAGQGVEAAAQAEDPRARSKMYGAAFLGLLLLGLLVLGTDWRDWF